MAPSFPQPSLSLPSTGCQFSAGSCLRLRGKSLLLWEEALLLLLLCSGVIDGCGEVSEQPSLPTSLVQMVGGGGKQTPRVAKEEWQGG